jgi:glycosyltransferase involved in cell wall biosynthesis
MNVAFLTPSYYPLFGGAEVFAQEICERLVKEGNCVDVITWGKEEKYETINGVNVYRMSGFSYFISMFFKLLELDRERNYDLVHSVQPLLPAHVATFFKKLRRKPHILTDQGFAVHGYEGRVRNIAHVLGMWSFKSADFVHVISNAMEKELKEAGVRKVAVIPNGVDPRIFKPLNKEEMRQELGYPKDERIVVCIARLVPVKGVEYLIRAIKLLKGVKLIIIGEGSERDRLEKIGKKEIEFLGFVARNKIPYYLNIADVFVLPSLHEGFGIVLIEAMACGIPVVGSRVDGIVDIIEDGKNGFLVPPRDPKSLASAIERLLKDEDLRERLGEEGLRKVRKEFTWELVFKRVKEIYKLVV